MNILNEFVNEIHSLRIEYQTKLQSREVVEQTNRKITALISHSLPEIRDYFVNHTATPQDLEALVQLKKEMEPLDKTIVEIAQLNQIIEEVSSSSAGVNAFQSLIQTLPENPDAINEKATQVSLGTIESLVRSETVEVHPVTEAVDGSDYFGKVLAELDRLKDNLGGGTRPTVDRDENHQTFLGIPMPAVKDWFRMVLLNKWRPQFFWRSVARLFGVFAGRVSQYEEAYMTIQRMGSMIANKERFLEILSTSDKNRYGEFGIITGLAWHPDLNVASVEKEYIEFCERFLTTYFDEVRKQGDEALISYFAAFHGVCFENRVRNLEEYYNANPIGEPVGLTLKEVEEIMDLNQDAPLKDALNLVGSELMKRGADLTPKNFLDECDKLQLLGKEFGVAGQKEMATLKDIHEYILSLVDHMTMDPYPINEFLDVEYRIFQNSEEEQTEAKFREQLQQREGSNEGFSVNSPEVTAFIQEKFPPE